MPSVRSSGRVKTLSPPDNTTEELDLFQAMPTGEASKEINALRLQISNLKRLQEVIHFLGSAPDLHALRTELLDLALSISGLRRGMLALSCSADDDSRRFKVRAKRGHEGEDKKSRESKVLMGILNRTLSAREFLIQGNIKDDGLLGHAAKGVQVRLGAVACLPLLVDGQLLGALLLDDPNRKTPFGAPEEHLLRSFARHAAVALNRVSQQSRLRRQASKYQRRSERLEAQVEASSRRVKKLKKAKQRLDASSGSADDELLGLLASGYSTAKRGFTRRYLAEVMRSCRGDLRAAANATGLPLPRLIGLLDHLDVR
jgi:transcriptional regulator with GAF, ATPase, and Fis domain